MVFNATFNNILVIYRGSQLYWWMKPEYSEKTIELPKVTDKLYHIMLYRIHLAWAGFDLTTLVVIGTDCMGGYKSINNYHTITTTTAPNPINLGPFYWYNIASSYHNKASLQVNCIYIPRSKLSESPTLNVDPKGPIYHISWVWICTNSTPHITVMSHAIFTFSVAVYYEKKVWTVLVDNSININKINNLLSS